MKKNISSNFKDYKPNEKEDVKTLSNESKKYYELEKKRIINAIKIFIVYGAEYFYLNYHINGNKFIDETVVNEKDMDKMKIKLEKLMDKTQQKNKIPFMDIAKLVVYRTLFAVDVWETNGSVDKYPYQEFRYIYNYILGNVYGCARIVKQFYEGQKVDKNLIKMIEKEMYVNIAIVHCFYIHVQK